MEILAINSSPKKGEGNTALILNPFLEGMRESGAKVELFYTKDLKIKPCQGDYICWLKTPGQCIHKDDMEMLPVSNSTGPRSPGWTTPPKSADGTVIAASRTSPNIFTWFAGFMLGPGSGSIPTAPAYYSISPPHALLPVKYYFPLPQR